MTGAEIDATAEKLYNYGVLHQPNIKADAIVALGNMDIRTARKAAELWRKKLAPVVVASGGRGWLTPKDWKGAEADEFARELYVCGVPQDKVLVEDTSRNLAENIRNTLHLLQSLGLPSRQLILVTLPYAERRVLALCQKRFPDIEVAVTSADISYEEFPNDFISKGETINLVVGEIERLRTYSRLGFIKRVSIPKGLTRASAALVKEGYHTYRVTLISPRVVKSGAAYLMGALKKRAAYTRSRPSQ